MTTNTAAKEFSYVDKMLEGKKLGNMNPFDLSDLYLLLLMYRRTYWQCDETQSETILHLADEVRHLYDSLYPNKPSIEKNRNARSAGRPKRYDEQFDRRIMELSAMGLGPTKIAEQMGCSKSYVSILIQKQGVCGERKQCHVKENV